MSFAMQDRPRLRGAEAGPHLSNLGRRLEEAWSQGIGAHPVESVIAPLATMLLLRWAEHVDEEHEAVAAFEGNEYCPHTASSPTLEFVERPS